MAAPGTNEPPAEGRRDDVTGALLDRLNTNACIVTSGDDEQRDGCCLTFVTASSMDPMLLLVLTSKENLTHEIIERSGRLAVHLMRQDHAELVTWFGATTGREEDKLARVAWHTGETGVPVLDDCLGYIEGRVLNTMDCGDHVARLVAPVTTRLHDASAKPLTAFTLLEDGLVEPRVPALAAWLERDGPR